MSGGQTQAGMSVGAKPSEVVILPSVKAVQYKMQRRDNRIFPEVDAHARNRSQQLNSEAGERYDLFLFQRQPLRHVPDVSRDWDFAEEFSP